MERERDIDVRLIASILPFPSCDSRPSPSNTLTRKCQRCHLNPPRGSPPAMKVRLRTENVILRNDSGHSPRGSGQRDVVRIFEER